MNVSGFRCSWFLTVGSLLVAAWVLAASPSSAAATRGPSDPAAAEGLVRDALRAETAGDNGRRGRLIERALAESPRSAAAHWHAGHVRAGNRWQTIAEAERAAGADPRLAEYRRLRTAWTDGFVGFDEQLALARWCQQQGLTARAGYHWYRVLQAQPHHVEALQRLGMVWYGGKLMSLDEVDRLQRDARRTAYALNTWGRRIERWADRIARRAQLPEPAAEALRSLRAVDDPDAIPALEQAVGEQGGEFARAAVAVLGNMPDHEATRALVRVAVLGPDAETRSEAAEQLRQRPLHDYVPLLMSGLEKPLEAWFHLSLSPAGHVTYRQELYREGAATDSVFQSTRSFVQHDVPGASAIIRSTLFGDALLPSTPRQEAVKARAKSLQAAAAAEKFAAMISETQRQVTQSNERSKWINERIQAVLARVTGQQFDAEPQDWWDWWQEYNEVYFEGEKPVYERYLTGTTEISLLPEVWMSCFPQGTLVWSQAGRVPIEQIRAGDLVLSQDVDTGELSYKPVMKTTVRPPSEILNLSIEGETIGVTRGHPFWATGIGWRMAKRLEVGQLIHGLGGSHPLDRIEEAPAEPAYNLVVGDFSTYFVGDRGILVHDNTYRRPTTAILPGLHR